MNLKRMFTPRPSLKWMIVPVALSVSCSTPQTAAASLKPTALQCEYRSNPLGIDVTQPHLNWQIQSAERNQGQSAYQILVAGSAAQLKANRGDLWDSGKVSSAQTVAIQYAGKPLASGNQCFWKVKVWDKNGQPSAWSTPGLWSMGLLNAKDWHGQWIGWDKSEGGERFQGANWIWFPEGNPAGGAPVGTRYFRRVFDLPDNGPIRTAMLNMTVDDNFKLLVNGQQAASGELWSKPTQTNIARFLKPGRNVLAIEAKNAEPSPAGLVGKLNVTFESGAVFSLVTDTAWKSADKPAEDWANLTYNDENWPDSKSLGALGMGPWGDIDGANIPARYLRRDFTAKPQIKRATAYMCGQGFSELYLNGNKISKDVLSPAMSEYGKRSFYVTYDVTSQLKSGANAVGVILGNGRYWAPRADFSPRAGYPKLLLQLNIEYADGTFEQVVSDPSWKLTTQGPIGANNEYDGEEYDARREMPNWSTAGFAAARWQAVQTVKAASPTLTAQIGEPIQVTQTMKPIAVTQPKPGVYVYDLGQNIGGRARLKVQGPAGSKVQLRFSEVLKTDGTLETANLRSAKVTDTYILKGGGVETYEPSFTNHGFRYVELTGLAGKPLPDAIEGRVVHDNLTRTGMFSSSNALLNKLNQNMVWVTRNNYRSLPTDLPRDERQGWLGDRQEVSKGESYIYDVRPIYAQWMESIRDAQRDSGSVSDVSPSVYPFYSDGTVWPSTYIIVPHMLYDQYGDTSILTDYYDGMKKWTDYMASFIADDIMPRNTYGDWCMPSESPTEIHSTNPKLITSGELLSTAIYYHDLQLMARSARLLNKNGDAAKFEALALRLKNGFNRKFYKPELGYYDNGTQTSCILPLAFDMVPQENKAKVFARLVQSITVEQKNHLAVGLVGGHYLLRVLSDNGRPDLAYMLATQTSYPSWGYMVSKGATTMWELWNGDTASPEMNSANIVMLSGDLNIWLNEYLGGVRPETPGFEKIIVKPQTFPGLNWVKTGLDSVRGRIESEWHQSAGKFDLQVTIPANTTAKIYLPTTNIQSITESGKPLPKNLTPQLQTNQTLLEIGSGHYHFRSNLPFPEK